LAAVLLFSMKFFLFSEIDTSFTLYTKMSRQRHPPASLREALRAGQNFSFSDFSFSFSRSLSHLKVPKQEHLPFFRTYPTALKEGSHRRTSRRDRRYEIGLFSTKKHVF
jgi:hypothetical protein